MITETYVSYDVAQLLKENCFNGEAPAYFNSNGLRVLSTIGEIHPLPCPTQQTAVAFLREECDLDIIPVVRYKSVFGGENPFKEYSYRIYDVDGNIVKSANEWYGFYSTAINAALKFVLTNLV